MNRNTRRVRTSCRLSFVGLVQDYEGQAQLLDLSFSGCRVRCQSPPPPAGTQLQVSVYLPGMEHPLSIELAVIRWVSQTCIGIQFCSMPRPDRERLNAWVVKAPYLSACRRIGLSEFDASGVE